MPMDGAQVLVEGARTNVLEIKRGVQAALDLYGDPAASGSVLKCLEEVEGHIKQVKAAWPALAALQQQAVLAAGDSNSAGLWVKKTAQQAGKAVQLFEDSWCQAILSNAACFAAPQESRRPAVHPEYAAEELAAVVTRVKQYAPHLVVQLCTLPGHVLFLEPTRENDPGKSKRSHPFRLAEEVYVYCPGVFSASIALAAPGVAEPLRVNVDGPEIGAHMDPWGSSRRQVFKRISSLATAALSYFNQEAAALALLSPSPGPGPRPPAVVLECILLWLAQYQDLFSRPCCITGKLLCWEPATAIPLPPVLRPFKLSLSELQAAANHPEKRKAYHLHLAPKGLIQTLSLSSQHHQQPPPQQGQLGLQAGGLGHWQVPGSQPEDMLTDQQLEAELVAAGVPGAALIPGPSLLGSPRGTPATGVGGGNAGGGACLLQGQRVMTMGPEVQDGVPLVEMRMEAQPLAPMPQEGGAVGPPQPAAWPEGATVTPVAPGGGGAAGVGAGVDAGAVGQPGVQAMWSGASTPPQGEGFMQPGQLQLLQQQPLQQRQAAGTMGLGPNAEQYRQQPVPSPQQEAGSSMGRPTVPYHSHQAGMGEYAGMQQQTPQDIQQNQQQQQALMGSRPQQAPQQHQQQGQMQGQSSPGPQQQQQGGPTTGSVIAAALQAADAAAVSAAQAVPADAQAAAGSGQPAEAGYGAMGMAGAVPQQQQQQLGGPAGRPMGGTQYMPGSSPQQVQQQQLQQQPPGQMLQQQQQMPPHMQPYHPQHHQS